jgi:hypothetical protein
MDFTQELIKSLLSLLVSVVTLGLGWFVGQRLSIYWAIKQKRRELELAAVSEFYKLYGEFFAIWKLWNQLCREDSSTKQSKSFEENSPRWELLRRASNAEGSLESLLVKIASEKPLSKADIEILGRFRQAYQSLRESISINKKLNWGGSEHPEYLTFKRLAYLLANVILSDAEVKFSNTLEDITSNVWEKNWVINGQDWQRLKSQIKSSKGKQS